jgi:hypothetical protein
VTDELRARLAELPTGELLAILHERDLDEWRPEAFPLIEAILTERHVDVAAALESLGAAATYVDFEALTEIATFSTAVDAHLCRMALEEAEIPCWVFNDHLAGVHVPLAMVVGVSARVRPEDEAAAREILEAVRAGAVAAPEEAVPCPRCGTETVRKGTVDRVATLATALTTGPPLAQSKWQYRCAACGHTWD